MAIDLVLLWNKKNVTRELQSKIIDVTLEDSLEHKAGTLDISFENHDGKFMNDWHPEQEDNIEIIIVDENKKVLKSNQFWLDEIEFSAARTEGELFVLRALSGKPSGFYIPQETKIIKRESLESAVKELALKVGCKVKGKFANEQVTNEVVGSNPMEALMNLAKRFGYIFKLENNEVVFYKYEKLFEQGTILLKKENCLQYKITNTGSAKYKSCEVKWYDRITKKNISEKVSVGSVGTEAVLWEEVRDVAQAKERAKNWLEDKNKKGVTLNLILIGDVRIISGMKVELDGFGVYDNENFIVAVARHKINRSSGYITEMSLITNYINKLKPKKKRLY